MNARTVYIVDDNTEFLQSAVWWLEGAGYDVECFDDPHRALEVLATPRAGACLLLDVRMPAMSGLEVHETLRRRGVRIPVVYMTGHGDVPLAVEAMRKGAVTFIEKPFADEALESALALAFSPSDAAPGESVEPPADDEFAARMGRLTAREREVIDWVVKGKLNKVIADLLGISIKTVELHRKNAMTKLQARSVLELSRLMFTGKVS